MENKEIRILSLLGLDTVFFLLEAIIGYSVHSLALIADSFHMLNDIISLIIALWAVKVKKTKRADGKYTYGWQRAEILGALINAVFLLALCFTIIMDAIQRFFEPVEVSNPKLILVVGIAGLCSNGVGLVLFHEHGHSHGHSHSHTDEEAIAGEVVPVPPRSFVTESTPLLRGEISGSQVFDYMPDTVVERYSSPPPTQHSTLDETIPQPEQTKPHQHDHLSSPPHEHDDHKTQPVKRKSLNMEGVFLHVLGDALGNVGVIITALIIWKTDYSWRFYADPVTSLLITLIIFNSALPLCRKSSKILLQATPPYINSNLIVEQIVKLPLVKSVHDFHVWNLNEDILIASLHLELVESCASPPPIQAKYTTSQSPANNAVFSVTPEGGSSISAGESDDEVMADPIDRKLFLTVVAQVRDVLHKFGIHSVTIQPEFPKLREIIHRRRESMASLTGQDRNAFGSTNKNNCLVDEYTNCDSESCA
ncbi:Zinc/cadmium resistance protein [Spathaspora sp. JA1]|nr:Zinc/cadmium resistance protein [Spathaspora sp. JA1]